MRPGVDLCQFGVTRIWPSPISPLPCRPLRQTGLARGGVRRGATKTSHRDGTGCDLRRCGGALPFPHTVTHFSRISIGISFLLSIKPPPKLKLPRLFGVGCVTRANLGWPRAGSVNSSTLLLSLSLVGWAGGFAPSTKQPSKAYPPRQQFATIFKVVTFFCNRRAELIPAQPYQLGESRIAFLGFHFFFFPLAWICDDGQGQGDTEHITHLEFRICHHHHWDTRGDTCIIRVLVFQASDFLSHFFSSFLHIARSSCLKAHTEETDTHTTGPSPSALVLLCIPSWHLV